MADHSLHTGDIVTCINGHPVYEITGEVPTGSVRHVCFFKPIPEDLAEPVNGQPIFGCPVCGEEFARPSGLALEFYINGEWK